MKLTPLTDYVLMTNEKGAYIKNETLIRAYAEFLQQELKLEMFLPCKEKDVLLKEPYGFEKYEQFGKGVDFNTEQFAKCVEHKKAKNKVLFNNVRFDTVGDQKGVRFYKVGDTQVFNLSDDGTHLYWHHYTIESVLSELDENIEIKAEF